MVMTSIVAGIILTVLTLWFTLITISKGYSFTHTIDPLNEGEEVREYNDNSHRNRKKK